MKLFFSICALCLALSAPAANAAILTHTFDISGLESKESTFLVAFPTLTHNFGIAGRVISVTFDINAIMTAPSFSSELLIAIDTNDDITFDADIDMSSFGGQADSDPFAATGAVGANSLSSDGVVYLTLWESFDDHPSPDPTPDAVYGAGSTVTVEFATVPEPASFVLFGVGLVLTVVARRRLA